MSIIVNPHNQQEEQELLDFLDRLNYNYTQEETTILSDAQQKEILERDRQYEAGETEAYTFNEFIAYFGTKEK
ncbi:MAG: hypothetical protein V4577_28850 [Bacteroidota bacterium]